MENFIEELLSQITDDALLVKESGTSEFDKGILFGYYFTISKILHQTEAFGLGDCLSKRFKTFNPEILLDNLD